MPRKDALKKMKDILLHRREALRSALAGDMSMLEEMAKQASGDVVDFALESAQDELNSQLAEVESRELVQIENALVKFEDGTYGKCEACQNNIPLARIQALPYAILCINCQRAAEASGINPVSGTDWSQLADSTDDLYS